MIKYWNTYKPLHFILSYVLTVTQQYKQRIAQKNLCNPSSQYTKCRITHETRPISQYVKAITHRFQQCQTQYKQGIVWELPLQFSCLTLKPLCICHKSSPILSCKERMGYKGLKKVTPWCKHCSCFGLWKATSCDAPLISWEIKSAALAVLKLRLSLGISEYT